MFFLLAVIDAMDSDTALTVAAWFGAALIGFYGFWAARLAGSGVAVVVLQALAVSVVGVVLIVLKALVH